MGKAGLDELPLQLLGRKIKGSPIIEIKREK
jgi:hypothetical protein